MNKFICLLFPTYLLTWLNKNVLFLYRYLSKHAKVTSLSKTVSTFIFDVGRVGRLPTFTFYIYLSNLNSKPNKDFIKLKT